MGGLLDYISKRGKRGIDVADFVTDRSSGNTGTAQSPVQEPVVANPQEEVKMVYAPKQPKAEVHDDGTGTGGGGGEIKGSGGTSKAGFVTDLKGLNAILAPEETEEQRKERERAETIKVGWTGMLDGLNALANLHYTTKWAPNQKTSNSLATVLADIKEKEKERKANTASNRKMIADYQKMIEAYKQKQNLEAYKQGKQDERAQAGREAAAEENKRKREHEEKMTEAKREFDKWKTEATIAGANTRNAASIAAANERNAATIAGANERARVRSGGSTGKASLTLTENGKPVVYRFDKADEGALVNVYNKLRDVMPEGELESLQMKLGEGGDVRTKALTLIQRHLPDHPELNEYVKQILSQGGGSEGSTSSGAGKKSPTGGKSSPAGSKKKSPTA